MRSERFGVYAAAAGAVFACCAMQAASAAEWKPEKSVEIVVPSGAGGGNDRIARIVQKTLHDSRLSDAVINIVNKPGAGQVVGMAYLNQQPPNGDHIGIASVSFMTNYITGRSPISHRDVAPLALLFEEYVGFAVKPDSKLKSGRDLLALLRTDAGAVSVAMSGGGAGNHNHLALAMITRAVGGDVRKLKSVGFASGRDAMLAALGGHVDLVVAPAATLLPQIEAGQLRMIALTSPKRLEGPFAPIPTWRELGTDVVISNWRLMVAPRGTGAPQIAYWETVLARVADTAEWKQMLRDDVLTNHFLRSAETRSYLDAQYAELRTLLTALGVAKQ